MTLVVDYFSGKMASVPTLKLMPIAAPSRALALSGCVYINATDFDSLVSLLYGKGSNPPILYVRVRGFVWVARYFRVHFACVGFTRPTFRHAPEVPSGKIAFSAIQRTNMGISMTDTLDVQGVIPSVNCSLFTYCNFFLFFSSVF